MSFSKEYLAFVLDQFEPLGRIEQKRLFGGMGFYSSDLFFGFIDDDVLFFKVDDQTRARYESAGSRGFDPYGDGRTSSGYYSVPVTVVEDRDELRVWALEAIEASRRKKGTKKKSPKKSAGSSKKKR